MGPGGIAHRRDKQQRRDDVFFTLGPENKYYVWSVPFFDIDVPFFAIDRMILGLMEIYCSTEGFDACMCFASINSALKLKPDLDCWWYFNQQ